MDLTRLRIFVSVADQGSFAAAAAALDYTPSAISQQMARLETEVGARLVDRSGRGVSLSGAGRTLLPHAREILDRVARAQHDVDVVRGVRRSALRLACFPTVASSIVAPVLRDVRRSHAEVDTTLLELEPFESLVALRDRRVDLAVVYRSEQRDLGQDWSGRRVATVDGLIVQRLLAEPYVLAVGPGHPLAGSRHADAASLHGERIIGNPRWPGLGVLAARLRDHGVEPVFDGLFSQSYPTVLALVEAGEGIAVVPALAAWRAEARVVVRALGTLAPTRDIDLVSLPGIETPAAQEARDLLHRAALRTSEQLASWHGSLERRVA